MSKEDKKELVPLPVAVSGNRVVFFDDAAAIIAKLTRERESWEKLFGEVALSLKCLPSCFVDDNSHVLRVAKEAMEQLAAVTQERNSFQDQCIRMRHERHVEKEQLAAARKDAERYDELCANPEGGAHLLRLLRDGKGGRDGLNNILDRCRLGRLAAMRGKEGE